VSRFLPNLDCQILRSLGSACSTSTSRVAPTDSVSDASTMLDVATRELQSGRASATDESASRMNLGLRLVPTPQAQICMHLHASCALCSLGWLNRGHRSLGIRPAVFVYQTLHWLVTKLLQPHQRMCLSRVRLSRRWCNGRLVEDPGHEPVTLV